MVFKINYLVISCLFFVFVFLPKHKACLAQDSLAWQFVTQIPLPNYEQVSINSKGQIYLRQENGVLVQLDRKGNTIAIFSPERTGEITSLFANNPLQIFLFYAEWQEFIILNRLLNPLKKGNLADLSLNSNLDLGFIQFACPSMDNQLWLVDNSDFSLKKYDIIHHSLEIQTSLDLLLESDFYALSGLEIYQNKIYLHAQNGILVFDTYGNYQKTIPIKNIKSLGFYDESLYYFDEKAQKIVFYNLYTQKTNTIPLPPNFKKIILEVIFFEDEFYFFFENDFKVFLYR